MTKILNIEKLKAICKKSDMDLIDYIAENFNAKLEIDITGLASLFIDRGAKVLGVAHLDSYGTTYAKKKPNFKVNKTGTRIDSRSLDDRIGVYTLLCQLYYSFDYDILITDGEEQMQSTAQNFETDKKYNWGFEFDRTGADIVTYKYKNDKWDDYLRESGFEVGLGSVSDITYLESLGCKMFNLGCGYHNEHSNAYMYVNQYLRNIELFETFITKNYDTHFKHKEAEYKTTYYYGNYKGGRGYYNNLDYKRVPNYTGIDNNCNVQSWYNCKHCQYTACIDFSGETKKSNGKTPVPETLLTKPLLNDGLRECDFDCNSCDTMPECASIHDNNATGTVTAHIVTVYCDICGIVELTNAQLQAEQHTCNYCMVNYIKE